MGSLSSGEPSDFFEKNCPVFLKLKNILDIRYILYACKVKHERNMWSNGFVSHVVGARRTKRSEVRNLNHPFFIENL